MAKKPDRSTKVTGLRQQAEERLRVTKRDLAAMPVQDVQRLVHELQVRQIELDIQNEELRQAQIELEAARDRYVRLYDFSPAGYLTLDTNGTIVEANLRAGMLLGVTRKGLIRQPLTRFIAAEGEDIFHRHCQEVLKTGTRQTCEVQLQGEIGAGRWVYLESIVVREEPGSIAHWQTAMLDITEPKRTEEKVQKLVDRLKLATNAGQIGVWDWNIQKNELVWDDRMFALYGVKKESFVGAYDTWLSGVHPDDRAECNATIQQVLRKEKPYDIEFRICWPNGTVRFIKAAGQVIWGMDGTPLRMTGVNYDITDRKRIEEALRESEERYRSIFENAVEGIFQTSLEGKYIDVNPALARIYGYNSPGDMIATISNIATQLYVDPDRRNEFIRLIQEQEALRGFESLVHQKDGRTIWVSENVRAMRDPNGVLLGYEGRVEDITERKLAEQRLRDTLDQVRMLTSRLETVQEEERRRISRELHDELGVRLTCLKIDLSRLITIAGDDVNAVVRAKLGDKVHSMLEQVDTTIAAVQSLATKLRPTLLDDLGLVAAIEWQCQDFQKRTGIPCTCVTNADDISMEPERATALFRICQESLTNTMRHAQATGVAVTFESRGGFLRLAVTDDGVGISDTQVSNLQSLGLLGMKERVEQLGGTLMVQGHSGKGTTVTACLPPRLS
ncbi:MAG: PAS domain S-box protein [Nitrospiraceae bacterium]